MRTPILFSLPLAAVLIAGCSKKAEADAPTPPPPHEPTLSQRAEATYEDAKQAVNAKLEEWNLTADDIKADLEKSGRVVREKTLAAGEKVGGALDNARIVTVINGKYVADRDLSALKINVDADQGVVTLTGTVSSLDLVGRAVALALDTNGVTQVIGLLKVEAPDTPAAASADPSGTM